VLYQQKEAQMSLKPSFIRDTLLAAAFSVITSCNTGTYSGRWMTWRSSDIKDFEKFPNVEFQASTHPFRFVDAPNPSLDTFTVHVKNGKKQQLLSVLDKSGTTAFIVVRNDSVLYERYLNSYDRESINTSFSVAKSITSLITGQAIEEGLLKSVNDPVTDYLPELAGKDSNYTSLTISHLLNMRSGIQFKDHDLPWGDKPKAYYHPDLRKRIMDLPITFTPGTRFQYNSYNPILTGMILERVSNQTPAEYFEDKIWNRLGMEYSGSWSMDSEQSGMTKMESGLNLRAIDFAKLGRLVLLKGNWNGEQVVSESWIREISEISPEHLVAGMGNDIYYKRFWWLFSDDKEMPYIISGWGHLGQYMYLFPNENVIIVRMGKKRGKVDSWKSLFQQVVEGLPRSDTSNKYTYQNG
jgi:CubicO group peptidase (beta-lactamase class C family)